MSKNQNTLVAVTGLSPQIVTETLYAILKSGQPMPDKIAIITTQIGANEIIKQLVDKQRLQQFCDDYHLPTIALTDQDISVIPDEEGEILTDINAQKQMNVLADFICDKIQELTENEETTLHASLAGGRKTMTFFLGMAMTLYGRKQDTLSHVLVTSGYESSEFYYPTPNSHNIKTYGGAILDAKYAKVVLTEIPFVRLRDDSPDKLLQGKASYSETIQWLNYDSSDERLTLNIKDRSLNYCNKTCTLSPVEFAFYQWCCYRAQTNKTGLITPNDEETTRLYAIDFIRFYAQHVDHLQIKDLLKTFNSPKNNSIKGLNKAYFEGRKTNIKKAITQVFGKRIGSEITINNLGKIKGKNHFGIAIASPLIHGENPQ